MESEVKTLAASVALRNKPDVDATISRNLSVDEVMLLESNCTVLVQLEAIILKGQGWPELQTLFEIIHDVNLDYKLHLLDHDDIFQPVSH